MPASSSTAEKPRIEIPLDFGDLGELTVYAHLDLRALGEASRLLLANTYQVGEKVVDIGPSGSGTTVVVRETADDNGVLRVASTGGTYRLSAKHITRPRTMDAD